MAKIRKDKYGITLRKGESIRENGGRYVYSYTDVIGRRKFIYAKSLVELRAKEKEFLFLEANDIDAFRNKTETLNSMFDKYLQTRKLKETTYENYTYMYDRFVRNSLGLRRLCDIKYSDIQIFYVNLVKQKVLAINTLESVNNLISPTLQMAVRDDLIKKNPAAGVYAMVKKSFKSNVAKKHSLTDDEIKALLSFLDNDERAARIAPLLKFMLGTGMRVGEVIGLRWSDVDLKEKVHKR